MALRVVVFFVLAMLFTMILGGLQQEAGVLPGLTFLPQWGPGIAGLITMLIFRKRDGVRITFFSARMPVQRYLWAVLLPVAAGLLAFLYGRLFLGGRADYAFTAAAVAMMLAGALGEEIGWRGYLQRRIAPHMNGLLSALLVGVLWTAFHMHLWAGGVLFMAFAALAFVSMSFMLHTLLAEYEFNVVGATLFHLAVNIATAPSFGLIQNLSLSFMIAYGVSAALVAVAVVLLLGGLRAVLPGTSRP